MRLEGCVKRLQYHHGTRVGTFNMSCMKELDGASSELAVSACVHAKTKYATRGSCFDYRLRSDNRLGKIA